MNRALKNIELGQKTIIHIMYNYLNKDKYKISLLILRLESLGSIYINCRAFYYYRITHIRTPAHTIDQRKQAHNVN